MLVLGRGLEPPSLAAPVPKTGAYTPELFESVASKYSSLSRCTERDCLKYSSG